MSLWLDYRNFIDKLPIRCAIYMPSGLLQAGSVAVTIINFVDDECDVTKHFS